MGYRARLMATTLGSLALVAAFAGGSLAQSPSGSAGGLAGTDWLLASVGGTPVASGTNADLLFTDAEAGGFAGCNRFFADYTSDGTSTLTLGPIATTMKACDDATDQFEQAYLAALATVASYAIGADGGLTLVRCRRDRGPGLRRDDAGERRGSLERDQREQRQGRRRAGA